MSRRNFLGTVSAGALGATIARPVPRASGQEDSGNLPQVTITINGRVHQLRVEPRWTLLYVLRDKLGLTGTKPGCERGECGSCTVLIDGVTRYSCLTLALEADGRQVTTVEGLMQGEQLGPVQRAFLEEDGFQCGYCTPGQVMSAEGLLRQKPNPTIDEIQIGMSGNLCRCGAYDHIFKSVRRAAELRK
ncbi:MAG: (2Fe-2S)-binding protein [Ignavibacteria bacterium]|nr:(2Fe-2S)-binding protein [Ignavibacteria bacterium]